MPHCRRHFLRWTAASGVYTLLAPACGYYPAESGPAYEPWDFPPATTDELQAVHAALLAASPHNTQPWTFRVERDRVDLLVDRNRSLGAMDSLHREMYIGLGCAVENLRLWAEQLGRAPNVTLLPSPDDPTWVASVEFGRGPQPQHSLARLIAHRHTNRGPFMEEPLFAPLRDGLLDFNESEAGVRLQLLESASELAEFRQMTVDATQAILDDQEMLEDSDAWYRHSKQDIRQYRDGVTIDATGISSVQRGLGKVVGRPSAETAGEYWLDSTKDVHTRASAFGILSTASSARNDRNAQLRTGQVLQRLWLWATQQGLALQPINQAAERQDREETEGLQQEFRQRLERFTGDAEYGAQILFRIGYPWTDAKFSPRRPVEWVMTS